MGCGELEIEPSRLRTLDACVIRSAMILLLLALFLQNVYRLVLEKVLTRLSIPPSSRTMHLSVIEGGRRNLPVGRSSDWLKCWPLFMLIGICAISSHGKLGQRLSKAPSAMVSLSSMARNANNIFNATKTPQVLSHVVSSSFLLSHIAPTIYMKRKF